MRRAGVAVVAGMGLALAACGPDPQPPRGAAELAQLAPSNPRLAALYASACKNCHTAPGVEAPPVRDREAWTGRLNQGLPVLVGHVVTGYKAMPAGGNCPSCTPDDLTALVRFMAGVDEGA
jgi:cytochrome c5